MKPEAKDIIYQLFNTYFNDEIKRIDEFPANGSYREYCRITGNKYCVIGAYNADVKENEAFFSFTQSFLGQNISVPKLYAISNDRTCYLQEDLGSETLYDYITKIRGEKDFSEKIISIYKNVISQLARLQILAGKTIDYSKCYPRHSFDKQSMMWDLNYFKYYFLKLAKIQFDEQLLEDDFQRFVNYLSGAETSNFLYRDFQSRNIMYNNGKVAFIDYQGGRKGALQYDLASLLYDAKADISHEIRAILLEYYLDVLEEMQPVDRDIFKGYFTGYTLIRIMQAMGAYGFRGFYEKKDHFLKSIPFAISNLKFILNNYKLPIEVEYLSNVLHELTQSEFLLEIGKEKEKLTVHIGSFSYKKGLPNDTTGNGGGFIFDCRAILNPGRYEHYKELTGIDADVINFLETKSEMLKFMKHVYAIVEQSIEVYISRGFTNLSVNFGCTGGQHRSVYGAENLAKHLAKHYDINISLNHREQNF